MTSTIAGEISEFCKDCLIIYISVTPVGGQVDGDRPELGESDSELMPSQCMACLLEGSVQP